MTTERDRYPSEWDARVFAIQFAVQHFQGTFKLRRPDDDNRIDNDWEIIRPFVEGVAGYLRESLPVEIMIGPGLMPRLLSGERLELSTPEGVRYKYWIGGDGKHWMERLP